MKKLVRILLAISFIAVYSFQNNKTRDTQNGQRLGSCPNEPI